MKLFGALLGAGIAWALLTFAPCVVQDFYVPTSLSAVIGAVATVLSAPWAAVLNRMSVFEKVDDLTSAQCQIVIGKARSLRRFIIRTLIANALTAVLCALLATFAPKSPVLLYALCSCLLIWLAGLFQAYRVWNATEESRLSIVEAQARERKRRKYLDAMLEDDRKNPVPRNDPHLNGYSS